MENDFGFAYQGQGLYDKDTGELIEKCSYNKLMERYLNMPFNTVWEGTKHDWEDTFINY